MPLIFMLNDLVCFLHLKRCYRRCAWGLLLQSFLLIFVFSLLHQTGCVIYGSNLLSYIFCLHEHCKFSQIKKSSEVWFWIISLLSILMFWLADLLRLCIWFWHTIHLHWLVNRFRIWQVNCWPMKLAFISWLKVILMIICTTSHTFWWLDVKIVPQWLL